MAFDFVIYKQNFKDASIGNTKKKLWGNVIVQGSGLARTVRFKFTLLLPKQCTCVDTKEIKSGKPVEQTQIRGPVFMAPTQSAQLLWFINTMYL